MFCPLFINAQIPIDESGKAVYTDVVEVSNLTAKQIYDKAKFWMVFTLKSGDNMVELSAENSDRIIGTRNIQLEDIPMINEYGKSKETYVNFKFIIFC